MSRVLLMLALLSCDGKDLYASCEEAADCEDVPEGAEPTCLPKADEGYCTWTCAADADCAHEDHDDEDHPLVCASFEDEEGSWCFPRCDEEGGCPEDFTCRSTGGGSDNRKVCFPDEG